MRFVLRILKALALLLVLLVITAASWLFIRPPELLSVGDGYAAKIVCSNVFIAGRGPRMCFMTMSRRPEIRCCGSCVSASTATTTA